MIETITWQAPAKLPDSETTVLLYVPDADEPVWPGFHDGDEWHWADGSTVPHKVEAWADLPTGPTPNDPAATVENDTMAV